MKNSTSLALALLLAASGAAAQTDLQARAWAASCAACHGTNGAANTLELEFETVRAGVLNVVPPQQAGIANTCYSFVSDADVVHVASVRNIWADALL